MYCGNCKHLNPTEFQQSLEKDIKKMIRPHKCTLYRKHLKHEGHHPEILKCSECINGELENRYVLKDGNKGLNINLIG